MAASSSLSSPSISIPRVSKSHSSSLKSQNFLSFNIRTLAFPVVSISPNTALSIRVACFSHSTSSSRCFHGRRKYSKLRASDPDTGEHPEDGNKDMQAETQATESKPDSKLPPTMEELIKAYKQAVLSGDDTAASHISVNLCTIEAQKNALAQKLSSLQAELSTGKERYIRLQADFENFRKRVEKDKLTVTGNAKGEAIESLLAMVDSFERAKQSIKAETEKEEKIGRSYQGIYKQFVEVMRSLDVAAIPTVGKPFDPSIHEAIARVESEEFKVGIVTQEIRRGFRLGSRVLRPATVKVSSGPAKKAAPSASSKPVEQAVAGVRRRRLGVSGLPPTIQEGSRGPVL